MCPLPEPSNPTFECLAAECIGRRLAEHGPAPWSICEARLSEDDYQQLCCWAEAVTKPRLGDASGSAGLVLLAFFAEWNRRHSLGDTVWVGLPPLFGVAAARRRLFTPGGGPTAFLYRSVCKACKHFQLRHAFADEAEQIQRYYLSIQLQYGFSLIHARNQLGNWLCGHRPPEVALRLLEPEGYYRSASFRRLVRDMRSYRRNYLPESDFRRTLRENPWVLPAWENEIVTLIDGIPRDGDEEEPEFRLLSDPRVTWEDNPEVWCRVCPLPDRLTASRYLLRHAGRDIARYYRHRSGAIEADRCVAQIPLDGPEAVVTLETPDGDAVEVQTIRLWDPELIAQVRPLGRETEETVERLLPGEQALITSTQAIVTPRPAAWRVVGSRVRPTEGDVGKIFDLPLDSFNRLMVYHPLLGCRALQAVLPRLVAQSVPQTRMLLRAMRLQLLSLVANAGPQAINDREVELLYRARGTFSENGEPMDEYGVREGLVRPVMGYLFDGNSLGNMHENNLRTALGVAPFREYLAAMILRRLLERLP